MPSVVRLFEPLRRRLRDLFFAYLLLLVPSLAPFAESAPPRPPCSDLHVLVFGLCLTSSLASEGL